MAALSNFDRMSLISIALLSIPLAVLSGKFATDCAIESVTTKPLIFPVIATVNALEPGGGSDGATLCVPPTLAMRQNW